MRCDEIRELVASTFIDKECSAEERGMVEGHLSACPECRAFHQAVVRTTEIWHAAPAPLPAPSVWTNIQKALEPRPSVLATMRKMFEVFDGRHVGLYPRPAHVLATLVVMVVVGGVFWQHQKGDRAGNAEVSLSTIALAEERTVEEEIEENGFGSAAEQNL